MSFQVNDWPMRRFVIVILTLLISFISLSYLENIGIHIPIIGELFGFLIITFVPGFIILRILRQHNIGNIKSVLFSVGLSLSFLMILGLIINMLYPYFGFKPFSFISIFVAIIISIIVLLVVAYIRDRSYISDEKLNFHELLSPPLILVILIPLVGIIGVYFVNLWNNNVLLMGLILVISLIPILIVSKNIPSKYYPLIIFALSITLLYHVSLFSQYVVGTDIFAEAYFANYVSSSGIWSFNDRHMINAALSIVIIPPIYAKMCNIDPIWYLKLISPFFLSLVPLGLYYVYTTNFKDKLTKKEIFLAVFFLIAMWQFYSMLVGVGRQQLAELFYILVLIMIFDEGKKNISNNLIFVIFSASLIFTHYSTANLVLIFVIIFIILNSIIIKNKTKQIGLNYAIFFLILTFSWTMYTAHGSVFDSIVIMINNIANSFQELFEPQVNVAVNILSSSSSNIAHMVYRYIFYAIVILIGIGGISLLKKLLFKQKIKKLSGFTEKIFKSVEFTQDNNILIYELFAFSNFIVLGLYLLTPLIGYQLGFDRVFQIASLVIAPYLIIGAKVVISSFDLAQNKLFKIKTANFNLNKFYLPIFAVFLSVFFLFNSGFVFEAINDPLPNSVPLSLKNVNNPLEINKDIGTLYLKIQTLNNGEFYAGKWFREHFDPKKWSYYTFGNPGLFIQGIFTPKVNLIRLGSVNDIENKTGEGYFYQNSISKIMGFEVSKQSYGGEEITKIGEEGKNTLNDLNKIYSSSGNDIYYYKPL